jgi:hypothetical protein
LLKLIPTEYNLKTGFVSVLIIITIDANTIIKYNVGEENV